MERSKTIPMEIKLENGSLSSDVNVVLNSGKKEFQNVYNAWVAGGGSNNLSFFQNTTIDGFLESSSQLNDGRSIMAVKKLYVR